MSPARPDRRQRKGFTLVEIMVVVLVVGILSALAIAVIGTIKQRTLDSLIRNNLRQLHQAQEFYFAESTPRGGFTTIANLEREGYLSKTVVKHLNAHSMEANAGWRYFMVLRPGHPVAAFKGDGHSIGRVPTGEIVYYPDPPANPAAYWNPQATR